LIQIDGSDHEWFEDRGPRCTLLVYIDDATSELMHLKMVESESTFSYMEATREYIERHGKSVAFYSDKHTVFRNPKATAKGDGMTHFGRALDAPNIEIICANSPQAKGRVERANGTLQDRLVKAMRLDGISSIAEANGFLRSYQTTHNARFARPAANNRDLHRPLAPGDDLHSVMVWREQRTVTAALTLHYNKVLFLLEPNPISKELARKRVDVCEYPDGTVEIRHEGRSLPYSLFDKMPRINQPAIVDNKHLDAALALAKEIQAIAPHHRQRNNNAPARRDQPTHLFPEPEASAKAPLRARSDRRQSSRRRVADCRAAPCGRRSAGFARLSWGHIGRSEECDRLYRRNGEGYKTLFHGQVSRMYRDGRWLAGLQQQPGRLARCGARTAGMANALWHRS